MSGSSALLRDGRRGLVALALAAACEPAAMSEPEPEPRESQALTDPYVWGQTPEAEDPFAFRRSEGTVCDPSLGFGPEVFGGQPAFGVDTGWCSFVTVQQVAGVDLQAGDRLEIQVWHGDLSATDAAEGFVGLALDGQIVWEHHEPIPGAAGAIEAEIEIVEDYSLDVEVRYHVDNHGANTWDLLTLVRHPREALDSG